MMGKQAKRTTVDWTEIIRGEPLWKVALRYYSIWRNWKRVATWISEVTGKEVTPATARKQCLLHACPDDLPLKGITRRATTRLFQLFLEKHQIDIQEWFIFVGNDGM